MRFVYKLFLFTLILLIGLWTLIASLRTLYNVTKLFTEEKQWFFLSDEQKKEKSFGDLHTFYRFAESHTPLNSRILFLSPGGKAYYLGRYYLYPRKIFAVVNPSDISQKLNKEKFDFLLVYQTKEKSLDENNSLSWNIPDLTLVATYSGLLGARGSIHKL